MKKYSAFSLAEVVATMIVLSFLAVITLPSIVSSTAEKKYIEGLKKANKTISNLTQDYLSNPFNYIASTEESAVRYIQYLIENAEVKELYADSEPNSNSELYSAIKFKGLEMLAGAKNPASISPDVELSQKPSFWFVTDDNIAYSLIIPKQAYCSEVLNINTLSTLDKTMEASCFVIIADTNGLFVKPNSIEDNQDISKEEYMPNLKNDRYYIFVGSNGTASGNPKHILAAKILSGKQLK